MELDALLLNAARLKKDFLVLFLKKNCLLSSASRTIGRDPAWVRRKVTWHKAGFSCGPENATIPPVLFPTQNYLAASTAGAPARTPSTCAIAYVKSGRFSV